MFQGVYVMILLDTCALLWFLHDDPMIPERVAVKYYFFMGSGD